MAGGGAVLRSASVGLIGVGVACETAIDGYNRTRAWCQRRRQRLDAQGIPIPVGSLSIYSNPSSNGNLLALPDNTIAQLEEKQVEIKKWKDEVARLQNVIQEHTDSHGKWIQITKDFDAKVKKIEQENLDPKTHMNAEIQKAEKVMEKNCQDIWSSKMERMKEQKENELRLTKMQMAKQKQTDEEREGRIQEAAKEEIESQNKAYKQIAEQATKSEQRTRKACSAAGSVLQCYIGSVDQVMIADKYIDEQAELIVRRRLKDELFVLVEGQQLFIEDALMDIGTAQKRRALARINAQQAPLGVADGQIAAKVNTEKKEEVSSNVEKLFDKAFAAEAQRQSSGGSNHSTPVKVVAGDDSGNGDGGDLGLSAFSVIKPPSGDDDGPEDSGHGGAGGSNGCPNGIGGDKEIAEFQLVN